MWILLTLKNARCVLQCLLGVDLGLNFRLPSIDVVLANLKVTLATRDNFRG